MSLTPDYFITSDGLPNILKIKLLQVAPTTAFVKTTPTTATTTTTAAANIPVNINRNFSDNDNKHKNDKHRLFAKNSAATPSTILKNRKDMCCNHSVFITTTCIMDCCKRKNDNKTNKNIYNQRLKNYEIKLKNLRSNNHHHSNQENRLNNSQRKYDKMIFGPERLNEIVLPPILI